MHLLDGVTPLGIDRDSRKKVIRVRSSGLQHILVADQEMGLFSGKSPSLIIDPVHAQEDSLAHVV